LVIVLHIILLTSTSSSDTNCKSKSNAVITN